MRFSLFDRAEAWSDEDGLKPLIPETTFFGALLERSILADRLCFKTLFTQIVSYSIRASIRQRLIVEIPQSA